MSTKKNILIFIIILISLYYPNKLDIIFSKKQLYYNNISTKTFYSLYEIFNLFYLPNKYKLKTLEIDFQKINANKIKNREKTGFLKFEYKLQYIKIYLLKINTDKFDFQKYSDDKKIKSKNIILNNNIKYIGYKKTGALHKHYLLTIPADILFIVSTNDEIDIKKMYADKKNNISKKFPIKLITNSCALMSSYLNLKSINYQKISDEFIKSLSNTVWAKYCYGLPYITIDFFDKNKDNYQLYFMYSGNSKTTFRIRSLYENTIKYTSAVSTIEKYSNRKFIYVHSNVYDDYNFSYKQFIFCGINSPFDLSKRTQKQRILKLFDFISRFVN